MDVVAALAGRDLLSDDQQKLIAGFCQRWNCSSFQALLETHMLSETAFADLAAKIRELPRLKNIRNRALDAEVVASLPFPFSRSRLCLVYEVRNSGSSKTYQVAIADPWDAETMQKAEDILGGAVQWGIAEKSDILEAIDLNFAISTVAPNFWQLFATEHQS